jgi:hypothetical protein
MCSFPGTYDLRASLSPAWLFQPPFSALPSSVPFCCRCKPLESSSVHAMNLSLLISMLAYTRCCLFRCRRLFPPPLSCSIRHSPATATILTAAASSTSPMSTTLTMAPFAAHRTEEPTSSIDSCSQMETSIRSAQRPIQALPARQPERRLLLIRSFLISLAGSLLDPGKLLWMRRSATYFIPLRWWMQAPVAQLVKNQARQQMLCCSSHSCKR